MHTKHPLEVLLSPPLTPSTNPHYSSLIQVMTRDDHSFLVSPVLVHKHFSYLLSFQLRSCVDVYDNLWVHLVRIQILLKTFQIHIISTNVSLLK